MSLVQYISLQAAHLDRSFMSFLDLGRLSTECMVITAQELSMRWASDFSFRSFSSRYLTLRFNL